MAIKSARLPMQVLSVSPVHLEKSLHTPLEDEALVKKRYYDEGYVAGYQEGQKVQEKLLADMKKKQAEELKEVLSLLTPPLAALDDNIKKAISAWVRQCVLSILRVESFMDAERIQALLEPVFEQLPSSLSHYTLRAHPEDKKTIEEYIRQHAESSAFTIEEDPTLSRGGLLVQGPHMTIDASLEERVKQCFMSGA